MMMRLLLLFMLAMSLTGCHRSPILETLDGRTVDLAHYRGQWIIINYWASWCPPCHKEIPELNAFYAAHKNQVLLLSVNADPPKTRAEQQRVAQTMRIQFPTLTQDPSEKLALPPVSHLPTTYLISPNGQIQAPLLGAQTQKTLNARVFASPAPQ